VKILEKDGNRYVVEMGEHEPFLYALGERIEIVGHCFYVDYANGVIGHSRRQEIVLLPWTGEEVQPQVGEDVPFLKIEPERLQCCPAAPYYRWYWRGPHSARWSGPDEPGWCSSAGTTGGGCIWNITSCEFCGATVPTEPPVQEKFNARRELLGLLKVRPDPV
jgi:hypothetical protein